MLGHGRDQVGQFLADSVDLPPVVTAIQDQQLGTGHACACALAATGELTGTVLVTYGDVPLLQTATLTALADEHAASGNAVTVLTARLADPTGYGRITAWPRRRADRDRRAEGRRRRQRDRSERSIRVSMPSTALCSPTRWAGFPTPTPPVSAT